MSSLSKLSRVGVVALALALLLPLSGGAFAQGNPPTGQKAPAAPQAAPKAEDSDVIEIVEEIKKEKAKPPAAKGPPSKDKAVTDEILWRDQLRAMARQQQHAAEERAKQAKNPAEAMVWRKEAQSKAELAENLKQSIVGQAPPPPKAATQGGQAAAPPPSRAPIEMKSGAFQQLKEANRQSTNDASQRDPDQLRTRARSEFGSGRAGAGGVALHKTATMQTPLDKAKIGGAAVEGDRLVLTYGGQKVRFPAFDPQLLALAIRSIYGGEGLVPGTIVALSPTAVVLSTGKELYGEVVWKRELLPSALPATLKVGDKVELEFGPGVGALSMPEPSTSRITYYGPIKGNLLGKAVFESDMVFSMYWYGVHWQTGRPIDPSKTPGFVSAIDVELQTPAKPAAAKTAAPKKPPLAPAKNWWEDVGWFVWNPAEMVLQLSPTSGEFEYVKATMRATVWGWRDGVLRDGSAAEGKYLTDNYDEFARAFPALGVMREAAKAVAAVRWLKQNNVALDTQWAKNYQLDKVETPELVPRHSVYVHRGDDGRPMVEKEASR